MTEPRALDGVRIVAVAEGPAVGLACMVLADFGAEVVRIERPGGDPWRAHPASRLTFRGQSSVVCDRNDAASTTRLREFVRDTADAVIVPDDRMDLADVLPDLIVCEVSAFGAGSGLEQLPLAEPLVAARLWRMAAFQGLVARGGPVYSALQVATHATGQAIASAIFSSSRGTRLNTEMDMFRTQGMQSGLISIERRLSKDRLFVDTCRFPVHLVNKKERELFCEKWYRFRAKIMTKVRGTRVKEALADATTYGVLVVHDEMGL